VSTVFAVTIPWMGWLQFVAIAIAFALGLHIIRRGLIIEPAAFIADRVAALTERIGRRFATSVT